jgi:hypothetical protein
MIPRSFPGLPVATVCLFLAMMTLPGCGGAVPTPKEFVTYHSTDGRFDCDCPKGWETDGAGKPESPNCWAKFTQGNAEVNISADLAGSLFGDIAKAGGAAQGGDAEPPVAKIHPMGVRQMKEDFNNYQEKEAVKFQSKGIGEGRRSIFIADKSLGGKIFGYRATLLSGDRRISVICSCPSSNWKALKPAFERITASLRPGGGR